MQYRIILLIANTNWSEQFGTRSLHDSAPTTWNAQHQHAQQHSTRGSMKKWTVADMWARGELTHIQSMVVISLLIPVIFRAHGAANVISYVTFAAPSSNIMGTVPNDSSIPLPPCCRARCSGNATRTLRIHLKLLTQYLVSSASQITGGCVAIKYSDRRTAGFTAAAVY